MSDDRRARSKEVDEFQKERYRARGLHRVPLYDGAQARRDKKAREADADEWIKELRAKVRATP